VNTAVTAGDTNTFDESIVPLGPYLQFGKVESGGEVQALVDEVGWDLEGPLAPVRSTGASQWWHAH
jgi:hypothetical protein